MEIIVSAIISGVTAGVAAVIVAAIQHRKTVAIIEYRIGELEAKVDKHNNLVERTYLLEKENAIIRNDIKVVNHRIGDLEKATS